MPVGNVAANSDATSAWANSVADSVNGIEADIYAAGQLALPWAAVTGKPATFAPSLGVAGAVVAETAYGQAKADGVSANAARADHSHGTPALPTPAQLALPFAAAVAATTYGLAKADGASTSAARADHSHGSVPLPTPAQTGAALGFDTPASADGGKRIYVGTATPTGASEGDIWIKG